MGIRIQKKSPTPASILKWAQEWLSGREHFTTGRLFRGGDVSVAGQTCALGAIRKAYYELDPEHDASKITTQYEDAPDEVLEADKLLASCLAGEEVTDANVAHARIVNTNDSSFPNGYVAICDGLACAVEKAAANG